MIGAVLVTVLIDGRLVDGSTSARLCNNVVMAPVAPYLHNVADRVQIDRDLGRIVVARGSRSISLPIAPYLRAGEPFIPLATVARALGVSVAFDAVTKTLSLSSTPVPIATLIPDVSYTPPAEPLETFTPQPTPAPTVTITGIPKPRRTPIVLEAGEP